MCFVRLLGIKKYTMQSSKMFRLLIRMTVKALCNMQNSRISIKKNHMEITFVKWYFLLWNEVDVRCLSWNEIKTLCIVDVLLDVIVSSCKFCLWYAIFIISIYKLFVLLAIVKVSFIKVSQENVCSFNAYCSINYNYVENNKKNCSAFSWAAFWCSSWEVQCIYSNTLKMVDPKMLSNEKRCSMIAISKIWWNSLWFKL